MYQPLVDQLIDLRRAKENTYNQGFGSFILSLLPLYLYGFLRIRNDSNVFNLEIEYKKLLEAYRTIFNSEQYIILATGTIKKNVYAKKIF